MAPKLQRVYTVVWTHYNELAQGWQSDACWDGNDECAEFVDHFRCESDARNYARIRTYHRDAAEPFAQDVPARIADRWAIC